MLVWAFRSKRGIGRLCVSQGKILPMGARGDGEPDGPSLRDAFASTSLGCWYGTCILRRVISRAPGCANDQSSLRYILQICCPLDYVVGAPLRDYELL